MSAVLWCLADVDSKLVKNPNVIPIGETECTPTVEVEFDLNGKPLTVRKEQKFKTKVVDDKVTSSSTNHYTVNGVEMSYTKFVENLKDRGIDTDNLLYFMHPDAFTADTSASGREKIRKIAQPVIDFANKHEVQVTIAKNASGELLSECVAVGKTSAYCKGMVAEVKEMVKEAFRCKIDVILYMY